MANNLLWQLCSDFTSTDKIPSSYLVDHSISYGIGRGISLLIMKSIKVNLIAHVASILFDRKTCRQSTKQTLNRQNDCQHDAVSCKNRSFHPHHWPYILSLFKVQSISLDFILLSIFWQYIIDAAYCFNSTLPIHNSAINNYCCSTYLNIWKKKYSPYSEIGNFPSSCNFNNFVPLPVDTNHD